MISNNLEAIEILKAARDMFLTGTPAWNKLDKALSLLQADEVELCKYAHTSSPGAKSCEDCGASMTPPKPTKETKLDKLTKFREKHNTPGMLTRQVYTGTLLELVNILLEEEY